MPRGFSRTANLTKDTLLALAIGGGIVIAASLSPQFFVHIARVYFKEKIRKAAWRRARKLRELEKKNLVSFKELGGGTVCIELTHKGKTLVRQYNFETMRLTKPKRWDRTWRIVLYDIPLSKKQASDAFRAKLRGLGLYPLQRSVWISPYECLPEIEFLASVLEIDLNKCVAYFKTDKIPNERDVKKFFSLV